MGLADAFSAEDRVSVKFSDFYRLMKGATKAELMMNAVNCDVPHRYIRETMTGKKEPCFTDEEIHGMVKASQELQDMTFLKDGLMGEGESMERGEGSGE